jgi:glucose/arabinose dehydrogenase
MVRIFSGLFKCRPNNRSSIYLISLILFLFSAYLISAPDRWGGSPSLAASLPNGFTEALVAGGMLSPTAMALAPDGRIFVCQQGGQLRVIKNNALLPTPFVSISVNSSGERGLLGVAFDPYFAANQYVYVYYTTSSSPIHNRVSRFTANGDTAVPGSEVALLDLSGVGTRENHNGGALHFGPDNKLYIAVGDNQDDVQAQSLNDTFGKILRINSDGTIPPDNPFFNQTTGNNRAIWVLGVRNPFTFNFQNGTGRMFINDVGNAAREEINDGIAGSNYGWPNCEGPCNPPNPSFRDPVYFYQNTGDECAITGGAFYNPATALFPAQYTGKYFFADYCGGWIKVLDPSNNSVSDFASGLRFPVDLQVGPDGSFYYLQRGYSSNEGQLWRIQFTGSQTPTITQHPVNRTVGIGQSATFSVAASGTLPLSYQWRRNGTSIPSANSASYTINSVTAGDNGARFSCFVSNAFGNALSNEAVLTVISNQPPTANITQPTNGTLYSGGQTINFAGTGTDPEQGTLPASAFTWEVVFHHDTHTHPFIAPFSGVTGGSFVIPATGHTETDVWYRIRLTVTDAAGLTHTAFRDVFPRTVTITLASNPSGLQLTLNGQPVTTPFSTTSVVGVERAIGAITPQVIGGTTFQFSSWSDGGAATHPINTPSTNTTYTATFTEAAGLQYYPLSRPIRLLDTRPGEPACNAPGSPLVAGVPRTQIAQTNCYGLSIPANATAIVGNATVVNNLPGAQPGFVTLYPAGASRPTVSNLNYTAGQIIPNSFTVALGANGDFNIYATSNTHFIVDITGYYAPPGAGGLYFHPLPRPIRLLDTRPGESACHAPGDPLNGGVTSTEQASGVCDGITIPQNAQAIVGNATVVNTTQQGGYVTLYPTGEQLPIVSNLNYTAGQIIPNALTVGLGSGGSFNIFPSGNTHFIVDVTGYFSPDATDVNGEGLLFYSLPIPIRLLDTRPGEPACTAPATEITPGAPRTQQAWGTCDGINIPNNAQAIVGNGTVVNLDSDSGYITLYPNGVTRPTVSNMNFLPNQIIPNAFMVKLGSNGRFNIFASSSTHFIVDLSGYFAP